MVGREVSELFPKQEATIGEPLLEVEGLEPGAALDAWRERLVDAWSGVIAAGLPAPGAHRIYFDRGDETLEPAPKPGTDHDEAARAVPALSPVR